MAAVRAALNERKTVEVDRGQGQLRLWPWRAGPITGEGDASPRVEVWRRGWQMENDAPHGGEVVQARVVYRGRHVRQMGAIPPVRQRIRMIEERGTFPEIGVVEECRHRRLEVIRQRRKWLDEGAVGGVIPGQMPGRFVDAGSAAFLAAQFGDVSDIAAKSRSSKTPRAWK